MNLVRTVEIRSTGLHRFRALPRPGEGLSHFVYSYLAPSQPDYLQRAGAPAHQAAVALAGSKT